MTKAERREYQRLYMQRYRKGDKHKKWRSEYNTRLALKNKLYLLAGRHECERCGFDDVRALAFHHRDPGAKSSEFKVKHRVKVTPEMLQEALDCEILCSNCHVIEHCKYEVD